MTLISVIYGNRYPVIVSDRAISDHNLSQKVVLPSTGRESNDPTHIVDFRVKSIIVKDILCIAFAGVEHEILRVSKEVLDYFQHREVNEVNLRGFLDDLDHRNEDLSVLFALGGPEFEHNKILVVCSGYWISDHSKEKLEIFAAGSGAREWINHFVEYQNYMVDSGDRLTDCQHRALLASIKYMSMEMHTSEHLYDGWGGGFDLIYYSEGRFHRYDKLTYAFWYAKEEDPDDVQFVAVNHNRYFKGNALVFNIDRLKEMEMEVMVVPQFRDAVPVDNSEIYMVCKSTEVMTAVFIKKRNGQMDTLPIAIREINDEIKRKFLAVKSKKGLKVNFSPAYIDTVKKALRIYLS